MNDAHGLPQTVFVLGGTSDIARCVLERLVARRARTVVLAGRDPDALTVAADDLRGLGAERVDTVPFEATDPASHQAVIDGVFERYGDIDLVLVAFGVLGDNELALQDPMAAVEIARVNYDASLSVGVAVANRLRAQGHGNLVVLSSVAAERARRSNFVYGSAKAGMDVFYRGLAETLRESGARVIIVRPGFVHTRMTEGLPPAPFATTPEAVADAVVDALRSRADVVWVPSVLRWVMSVLRHLPAAVFRKLPA